MTAPVFKIGDAVTVITFCGEIVRAGVHVTRAGKRIALSDGSEWADKRGMWERYGRLSWLDSGRVIREHRPTDATRAACEKLQAERADLANRAARFRIDAEDSVIKAERFEATMACIDANIANLTAEIDRLEGGPK